MHDYINRMIERLNGIKQTFARIVEEKIITQKEDVKDGYTEPSRIIPILATCDVLVVGGGPSGISASIASARAGADTLIIEKFGCLGGVITTVGMETIGWYRYEGTTDCKGIGIEMEKIAEKMGGTLKWPYNDSQCLDADFFKIVADRLIEENGVRCILHCYAVESIMEDNVITGIITESKSGRMAIMAKRVIDCTGDADIVHFSHGQYYVNKVKDRMSATTIFSCAGVDKTTFLNYTEQAKRTYKDWNDDDGDWQQHTTEKENELRTPFLCKELINKTNDKTMTYETNDETMTDETNDKTMIDNNILIEKKDYSIAGSWSSITDAGEATNLNLIHMKNFDCTNVMDITQAEIKGRKISLEAITALKKGVPGFENAKLRNFGMTLGVRDTRKIVGEYNLTGNDVLSEAKFNDSIGIFPEFVDGYNIIILPSTGRYFQVPYRCLIPVNIDNLLVAGRCVAGDNVSHAAMRNMMACTVTGQGAGVASAISIKENVNVRDVDIKSLQEELIRQGVRIE